MSKKANLKILTANRLVDGEAVWFGAAGNWIETLEGARIAEAAGDVTALEAIAVRDIAANLVVDIELIDIERVAGGIRPVRLRERIRASGPTFRADLGKQANQLAPRAA
jgi:hypothetical protein